MHPQHLEGIQRVTAYFQRDPEIQALLLGGGFNWQDGQTPVDDL